MSAHKAEALTVPINFRVSPVVDRAIDVDRKELDITESEYLRLCLYIGGPLLRACPALMGYNRQQLKELMQDICKKLVIQPQNVRVVSDAEFKALWTGEGLPEAAIMAAEVQAS